MSFGCKIETEIKPYSIDLSNQELLTHFQAIQDYYDELSETICSKNDKNQPDINLIYQQPELQPVNLSRNNIVNFMYQLSIMTRCFSPVVFHASCRIYDRYSSKRVILKLQQKLVASTCLWMVAKSYGGCNHVINNEVVATNGRFKGPVMRARIPRLKELVQIIHQTNKQETGEVLNVDEQMFKQMEKHILDTLQWDIIEPMLSEYIMNVDEFCILQYEHFISNGNNTNSVGDQDLKIFMRPSEDGSAPSKVSSSNDYFSKICNVPNPVNPSANNNANNKLTFDESDLFYKLGIMKIKFFILDIVQFDLEFVKFKYSDIASACLMFLEMCLPGSIDEKSSNPLDDGLNINAGHSLTSVKLSTLHSKISTIKHILNNSSNETNFDNLKDNLQVLQNELFATIQSNFNGNFLSALIKTPEGNKRTCLYIRDKIWSNLIMNITGANSNNSSDSGGTGVSNDEYRSVYMKNCILQHCNANARSKLVINSFIKRAIDLFNCKVDLQNMMDSVLSLKEECDQLAKEQYMIQKQPQLNPAAIYLNSPASTFIQNSSIASDECPTAFTNNGTSNNWSTPQLSGKRRHSFGTNDSDMIVTPVNNNSNILNEGANSDASTPKIMQQSTTCSDGEKMNAFVCPKGVFTAVGNNVGPGSYITPPASRTCSTTGSATIEFCKDGKFPTQQIIKPARQFGNRLASIDLSK
ncbi:hypothetical protein ACO0SA_000808 [Hanseniaspora valbyensis]